jgi:hypothetical protein
MGNKVSIKTGQLELKQEKDPRNVNRNSDGVNQIRDMNETM